MKPIRTIELTNAVKWESLTPICRDGRGHRTPATQLMINERERYLIEAARFFPGASDREIARQLRTALSRYRDGRWRRDQVEASVEPTCPPRYRGTIREWLWLVLRTRDRLPSEMTIRRAIRDPAAVLQSNI